MTFTQELIEKNLSVWQQCLDSPFLQQLGAGTLDERYYQHNFQATKYDLIDYSRAILWMTASTSGNMPKYLPGA